MESGFSVQRKPTCRTSGIYSNTSLDWREGEWLFRAAEANLPNFGIYSNTSLERWVSG